jgi:hypothetical protein
VDLLLRLRSGGVQLSGPEDLQRLLELEDELLLCWEPLLEFRWYGVEEPASSDRLDLNHAPMADLQRRLSAWPQGRLQRLMRERRRRPLQDLADLQERLALPPAAVEELIGKVCFGAGPAGPALPPPLPRQDLPDSLPPLRWLLHGRPASSSPMTESPSTSLGTAPAPWLELSSEQLITWQRRVVDLQRQVARDPATTQGNQLSLLAEPTAPVQGATRQRRAIPWSLTPQSLEFWRWPRAPQQGAAIYFVIDRPPHLDGHLLLYVGETGRADQRWRGEHDCKTYLAAYTEAIHRAALASRLSIRFWCDVPAAVEPRRRLEQELIQRWRPPFNKETRDRWATPFTSDPA